jgi:hypothetical protein
MAGKEIDRMRARSAMAVIREHPVMVLFVISPVLIAAVVIGYLTSSVVWPILFLLVAAVAGTWIVVRKR